MEMVESSRGGARTREERVARPEVLVDARVARHLPRLPDGLQVAQRGRGGGAVPDGEKADRWVGVGPPLLGGRVGLILMILIQNFKMKFTKNDKLK